MLGQGLTFVLTMLVWWLSTGVILMLCSLPRRTFGWSLAGGAILLGVACYGLVSSAVVVDTTSAYVAFLGAVALWGVLEMGFLMGYVTGPRKIGCPAGATGWRRFCLALSTVFYRELVGAFTAAALLWLNWGQPNQIGSLTFVILLVMRISAELNIFLGVPNLPDELLPERLGYLKSYFRAGPVSLFFPASMATAGLFAVILAGRAFGADGPASIGAVLLLTLLMLAMLEHFFMITKLPDAALWRWARQLAVAKPLQKPLP
jgi:putative photosynthetic complex assembly protein 2